MGRKEKLKKARKAEKQRRKRIEKLEQLKDQFQYSPDIDRLMYEGLEPPPSPTERKAQVSVLDILSGETARSAFFRLR